MVPDFIVIGAGRSGTTSLHHYLTQHPQIAMSRQKETNFFAALADREKMNNEKRSSEIYPVRSDAEYASQFSHADPKQICGETSPRYIYAQGVPEQIATNAAKARLIVILRDPVERAWSNWMGRRNAGWEKGALSKPLTLKPACSINVFTQENLLFFALACITSIYRGILTYFRANRCSFCYLMIIRNHPLTS